jgi:hypothetical protein
MNKEVTSILNLQRKAIENNLDCITIYLTIDNPSKTIIQTELINQIKGAIRSCSETLEGKQIHDLSEKIVAEFITLPFYKRSIGIFIIMDTEDPKTMNVKLSENLEVIFSDVPLMDFQMCGKIFSLNNLFKMTNYFHDTLCIYVSRKETYYYLLNQDFRQLERIENEILEAYEDRFRFQTSGSEFMHGGSSADEKENKFAKKILNDMVAKVKELAKSPHRFKNIIVFYTNNFVNFEDFLKQELAIYSETPPVISQKVVDTKGHFEEEFKRTLHEYLQNITKMKLEKYKTSIDGTFQKNFIDIVAHVRDARVHKLYIKEDYRHDGYILTKDSPYLEKVDGAMETSQLCDWMIKKVIDTAGEVYVLDKDDTTIDEGMVVKLRY